MSVMASHESMEISSAAAASELVMTWLPLFTLHHRFPLCRHSNNSNQLQSDAIAIDICRAKNSGRLLTNKRGRA